MTELAFLTLLAATVGFAAHGCRWERTEAVAQVAAGSCAVAVLLGAWLGGEVNLDRLLAYGFYLAALIVLVAVVWWATRVFFHDNEGPPLP